MKESKKGKNKSKYATELERLRALNAIKEVLKKGDIENAALTNTSKDSETVGDNTINTMLDELNLNKNSTRDLEIIEGLSSKGRDGSRTFRSSTKIKQTKAGIKARKKIHIVKRSPGKKQVKSKKR
jgi:hypothetical protein